MLWVRYILGSIPDHVKQKTQILIAAGSCYFSQLKRTLLRSKNKYSESVDWESVSVWWSCLMKLSSPKRDKKSNRHDNNEDIALLMLNTLTHFLMLIDLYINLISVIVWILKITWKRGRRRSINIQQRVISGLVGGHN